ncbi:MAG: hypothetical protein FWB90_01580 [Fibromonadales bacterium]|nr:hypothetical protein [Fibromonadales bacterium]
MKNFLVLGLFAVSLAMFFACSNDGFDIKEPASRLVSCIVQEGECHMVSAEVCATIGGSIGFCLAPALSSSSLELLSSSSSETEPGDLSSSSEAEPGDLSSSSEAEPGDSSSSSEVEIGDSSSSSNAEIASSSSSSNIEIVNSSSSVVVLSSSSRESNVPDPIKTGKFEFRFFDYSSNSNKIYFFNSSNMRESQSDNNGTAASSGKLLNTLDVSNKTEAACVGEIIVKSTLGGTVYDIPKRGESGTGAAINRAGPLISKAYMMCDGIEKEIASTAAEVVANPSWDANCKFPTYVGINENIRNVATLNDNYGRCNIRYSPNNYPNTASSPPAPTTFSTTASCTSGVSESKSCQGSVTVVQNVVSTKPECGGAESLRFDVPSGYSVLDVNCYRPEDNTKPSILACWTDNNTSTSFTINGTSRSFHNFNQYDILEGGAKVEEGFRALIYKQSTGSIRCAVW